MKKFIVVMALLATSMAACAYNPTTYQQIRDYDNANAERANGL